MSCLEFIDKYAEESAEEQKDCILDDTLDCLKAQEDGRNRELQDFIDDFVKSEEYADYIEEKRAIIKRSAATQCEFNEIILECEENERLVQYPLTQERKKMYAFQKHFELYAENLRKNDMLRKQKYGIQVIRMKIHEAKRIFECTREFKEKEKKQTDQFLIQKYSAHFGVDMRKLSSKAQIKILDRFKKCHQKISLKNAQRQNNLIKIGAKLCEEEKLKRKKKKEFKIPKREKIILDMEIVGTHIELIDRDEKKLVEVEPINKPSKESQIKVQAEEVKVEKEKGKKGKDKKEKPSKVKDEKKSEKKQKAKESKVKIPVKFVLPNIPIINPRKKILPENIDDLINLVEEFRDLDNEIENVGLNQIHPNYPLDYGLQFKPQEITFQNYKTAKSYNKKIIITNVSSQIRKVRFLRFEFEDQYDQIAFKIAPFGIQKLFTGSKFQFNLNFQPWDDNKLWIGKLIFVSYDTKSCQYYQCELALKCRPKYSNLIIRPDSVKFAAIPIWKTSCEHFKTIKFQNTGAKPCTVSIRKIWDPLEIESILDEDEENKENVPPKSSSNNMVEDILDECLKNVDNNFEFSDGYFTLAELDEKLVKVTFKNASYVGDYLEKFRVEVLERDQNGILQTSGCQIISLNAETTGHVLATSPEVIDFSVCLIHTCYQASFDICNNSHHTQAVSVKVPASLAEMVQTDVSMVYIGPKSSRTVLIKLIPRLAYNRSPYFDKNNLILQFPVRLYATTKTIEDYPPIKLPVYAIITNSEDLTISCNSTRNLSNLLNTILIDVGDCSIYETLWTEISLTNNTAVTQICGFVNLPKCVTLVPGFGFCKLQPGQRKKFKIYISPDIKDFPSYSTGSLWNNHYFFKIKVDTVCNLGKLAIEDSLRESKESSMDFAKKLTITDAEAFNSMTKLVSDIKQQSQFETTQSMINKEGNIMSRANSILRSVDSIRQSSASQTTNNKREDSMDMDVLNYHNFLIVETESRREVWCKVNIRRPWLEFSHQFVQFPDTPPGSYSTMDIALQALEREIENPCARKKSRLDYKAHFQIAGGGQEIFVEPSCGVLRSGDSIKITMLVKPKIPNETVEKIAKSLKYAEVYGRKLEQYNAGLSRKQGNTSKKPKKSGSNKPQTDSNKEEQPNITVNDNELVIGPLDLFPAEMECWKTFEPYYIKDNFTCTVDYETPKGHRKKDLLYLEAVCKVIRPDFTINLNQQRVDFGNCLVGMSAVRRVKLQNIMYKPIKPRVSLLNPLGPFSVPYFPDSQTVAPQECMEIPITFKPTTTGEVIEYIEIQSNASIMSLVLCGQGKPASLNLSPQFGVFRLETKPSKLAELQFKCKQIENQSEAPASVRFDKVFEVEGLLADLKPQTDQSTEPQNSKSKGKGKKTKEKAVKTQNSDDLTEEEVEAIGRAFKLSEGGSHINFNVPQTCIELPPNARSNFTIVCGNPELINKKQTQGPKEKKKKDKQESVGNAEVSTIPDSTGVVKKATDNQYIAQFNINVGNSFIKSIVIICTIKA